MREEVGVSGISTAGPTPPPPPVSPRRGVLPWPSWDWQLAGLITVMVIGVSVMGFSFNPEWERFPIVLFLSGLGLLTLASYSAIRTNWLKDASTAPLTVKVGAGAATICGLTVIGAVILFLAFVAIIGVIIIIFISALLS